MLYIVKANFSLTKFNLNLILTEVNVKKRLSPGFWFVGDDLN